MSTAKSILFGSRSLEEIASAAHAAGEVIGEVEVIAGRHPVLGTLVFASKANPDLRRALWVFDGSVVDASPIGLVRRGELPKQRTLLSIGAAGLGPEILARITGVFGGYFCKSEESHWERLGPDPVSDEAKQLGTKVAEQMRESLSDDELDAVFRVLQDPRGRDAFLDAWRTVAIATTPMKASKP